MTVRDARRWPRLDLDALIACRISIELGGKRLRAQLRDLSPGGAGIHITSKKHWLPNQTIAVWVRFRGERECRMVANISFVQNLPHGLVRLGLAWDFAVGEWTKQERRKESRLALGQDHAMAVRLPHSHVHRLWARLAVLNLSPDRGLQLETRGGPIYLLPGMDAKIHLDLPLLGETPLRVQVLWIHPSDDETIRMGVRVLDLESPAVRALDEWLILTRKWSPAALRQLGFAPRTIPGQYRFRRSASRAERQAIAEFHERCSKLGRIGWEHTPLPQLTECERMEIGVWDNTRIVAAITAVRTESNDLVVKQCSLEWAWFGEEVIGGLAECLLRTYLGTHSPRLWIWCPLERLELRDRLGLESSPPPFDLASSQWISLDRNALLWGKGIPLFHWASFLADTSAFALQQGSHKLLLRQKLSRWGKLVAFSVLREVFEPRILKKLRAELDQWSDQIMLPKVTHED